jgi:hypothetical protein
MRLTVVVQHPHKRRDERVAHVVVASEVGTTVQNRDIENLPLVNRNVYDLLNRVCAHGKQVDAIFAGAVRVRCQRGVRPVVGRYNMRLGYNSSRSIGDNSGQSSCDLLSKHIGEGEEKYKRYADYKLPDVAMRAPN